MRVNTTDDLNIRYKEIQERIHAGKTTEDDYNFFKENCMDKIT